MTLPKYTDVKKLQTIGEIEKEIFVLTKTLFDLRMKRSTNQTINPHIFVHTKHQLSQYLQIQNNFCRMLSGMDK